MLADKAHTLADEARMRAQAFEEDKRAAEEKARANRSALEKAEASKTITKLKPEILGAANKGQTSVIAYRWNSYVGGEAASIIKHWAESEGFTVEEHHSYDKDSASDSSSMMISWA